MMLITEVTISSSEDSVDTTMKGNHNVLVSILGSDGEAVTVIGKELA